MKDYNKENEIRILEEIKTFCESMISLNSTDKRSEKIEAFFEEMKKKGVIDEDFNETDENQYLKSQYITHTRISRILNNVFINKIIWTTLYINMQLANY